MYQMTLDSFKKTIHSNTFRTSFGQIWLALFFGLSAASISCDIETSAESADLDIIEGDDSWESTTPAIEQNFMEEPYGVGSEWFDYDLKTHGITPKAHVYRLNLDEAETAIFRVDSY